MRTQLRESPPLLHHQKPNPTHPGQGKVSLNLGPPAQGPAQKWCQGLEKLLGSGAGLKIKLSEIHCLAYAPNECVIISELKVRNTKVWPRLGT